MPEATPPTPPTPSPAPPKPCTTRCGGSQRAINLLLIVVAVIAGAYLLDRWRAGAAVDAVPWVERYDQALAQSQASGKPILVHYSAPWCGSCTQMKTDVFAYPHVADQITDRFIPLKQIDGQLTPDEQRLQMDLGVRGIPASFVLSPDGELLAQHEGYLNQSDFLAWLPPGSPRK